MTSRISSQILVVSSGKLVISGFLFLSNILLTRYLGAQAFGIYSSCIALIVLISGVVGDTLDLGVLRFVPPSLEKDRPKALLVLKVVFKIKLFTGILFLVLFSPIASDIGSVALQATRSGHLIRLVFLGIIGTMLFKSANVYLQSHQNFGKYLFLDFVHTSGKLVLITTLIFLNLLTVTYSVVVYAIMPLLTFFLSLWIVPRDYLFVKGSQKQTVLEVLFFSKWLIISSLVGAIHSKLDILMLSILRGSEDTGIYAAALNLALIPDVLSSFFTIVFYPKIMPMCHRGEFTQFFHRYLKNMVPLCIIGVILSIAIAKPLILSIYTTGYFESVAIFKILIPGTIFWILVFPLALAFIFFNKPHLTVPIDLATLAIVLLGNLFFIPKYGALGASIITLFSRILVGSFILIWVLRKSSYIERELQISHK